MHRFPRMAALMAPNVGDPPALGGSGNPPAPPAPGAPPPPSSAPPGAVPPGASTSPPPTAPPADLGARLAGLETMVKDLATTIATRLPTVPGATPAPAPSAAPPAGAPPTPAAQAQPAAPPPAAATDVMVRLQTLEIENAIAKAKITDPKQVELIALAARAANPADVPGFVAKYAPAPVVVPPPSGTPPLNPGAPAPPQQRYVPRDPNQLSSEELAAMSDADLRKLHEENRRVHNPRFNPLAEMRRNAAATGGGNNGTQ